MPPRTHPAPPRPALRRRAVAALLTLAVIAAANEARAGDAAARHVLGFSPDGHYFAFEQYSTLYEQDAAFSEYVAIDTRTDRFVAGTPVRVLIRGDDGLDADKARADAAAKAKPLLARLGIGRAGTQTAGKPSMALDEIGIYQMEPQPLARALAVPLPDGRSLSLTLSERALGSAMCAGYGGTGTAGRAKIVGLQLSMQLGGATTLLQEDAALPRSRRCAHAYGIAEAWLHRAPDGGLTLAVLVEYADNDGYHAGPNRRFLAVTRKLPKP